MKRKYFIRNISNYAIVGGLGSLLIIGLSGCENKTQTNQSNETIAQASDKKNVFVVIEKSSDGSYKIIDEFPSTNTTIVLRENGIGLPSKCDHPGNCRTKF